MKKLSKKQQALLEHALEKIYTFIKTELNVEVTHDYYCVVYKHSVRFSQCSNDNKIAWDVYINFKTRKILIITREAEVVTICSQITYDIIYMGIEPKTYTLNI